MTAVFFKIPESKLSGKESGNEKKDFKSEEYINSVVTITYLCLGTVR